MRCVGGSSAWASRLANPGPRAFQCTTSSPSASSQAAPSSPSSHLRKNLTIRPLGAHAASDAAPASRLGGRLTHDHACSERRGVHADLASSQRTSWHSRGFMYAHVRAALLLQPSHSPRVQRRRFASTASSPPPASARGTAPSPPPPPSSRPPPPPPSSSSSSIRTQRRPGRWRRRTAITLGVLGVLWAVDEWVNARVMQRNILTAYTGAAIALDYKFNFDSSSEASAMALHERCAARLLRCCDVNQGLYVKLGQAIGANAIVLPKPYHAMARMFDDAERMPWDVVRRVVEEELGEGRRIEDVFEEMDEKPIAAASVAQVHRARLRRRPGEGEGPGPLVAIKVQRPQIRAQAYWDLLSFRILLRFYERVFELPMSYFGQYISDQIERETHFLEELRNCERLRHHIANDPVKLIRDTVTVPRVYPEISTDRMLVMEFIDGAVRMTDRERIEDLGLSVKGVANSVCEVFASMIFRYRLVQADGHGGNVLVRRHPDDVVASTRTSSSSAAPSASSPSSPSSSSRRYRHQVVLIDHGLCIELRESFTRDYAQLWQAIFELDLPKLDAICREWGMAEGSSELLASATLMRPWRRPRSEEESRRAKEEFDKNPKNEVQRQKERLKNFLVHVEKVPEELIFVGRSMRIIQANNQTIGSPANRLNILARHAAAALLSPEAPSLWSVLLRRPARPAAHIGSDIGGGGGGGAAWLSRLRHAWSDFVARLSAYLRSRLSFVRFRSTLLLLDSAFYASSLSHWARFAYRNPLAAAGLRRPPPLERGGARRGGFEDDLERSMRAFAKEEMGVELTEDAFIG